MATTRQILEQPQSPFIQRIKSSPMIDDKEEELSRSALAMFKAKEDEIERRKMEVKDRVQTKLGLAEEATRRLAEIREELEALTDPMRKEISAIRKRVDAINRELKPLGQSCQRKFFRYENVFSLLLKARTFGCQSLMNSAKALKFLYANTR
ncbi:unnamed protein product [Thlaspi arvense]|uniref:RAB6-interacting golgin n=1 Tax=Thlaspi arvense TaxID=13288 RepID=A0AAU9SCZ9_THLAR|nr:unnamed protein product [Thlaspi arvense]